MTGEQPAVSKSISFVEYFFKYGLPPLVTLVPAVFWLASVLGKMDANVRIVVDALNDRIIPAVEAIGKQDIAPIRTVDVQLSSTDSLQLANSFRIDNPRVSSREIYELVSQAYTYKALSEVIDGNLSKAMWALQQLDEFYTRNKHIKPPKHEQQIIKKLRHMRLLSMNRR